MAEEAKDGVEVQPSATDAGAAGETLVGDLQKVDPKVLQAEIDRQVRKALKSREENIAKQTAAQKAEQDRKAAEERGEYEKLKAQLAAERDELKRAVVLKDVSYQLREAAREAGLVDLDDLKLMEADAVAQAVDESGAVDAEKVQKLVADFKAAKPHKFKGQESAPRFGGVATPPPSPGQAPRAPDPHYFRNEGLDEAVQARKAAYERMSKPVRTSDMDALAAALAKRLKL